MEPGTGLDAIAAALPGGDAAKSAPALASTFNERGRMWAGEIDRWSESVAASAKSVPQRESASARSASSTSAMRGGVYTVDSASRNLPSVTSASGYRRPSMNRL